MRHDIDLHLAKRLRRRRLMLGLTQQQLAVAIGVRFQQIQKYECGANRLSASRLWQLTQALNVPVSYFFDGLREAAARTADGPSQDNLERCAGGDR
jgi:transcriptional regulator with XRE-family HTH domain